MVSYTYDSWGKPYSVTGTKAVTLGVLNPFRYRGYVYDEETGWYYLKSRYYDPEVGRFLNADSIIPGTKMSVHGYNLYSYCQNDPVNMEDTEGMTPHRCGPFKSASYYMNQKKKNKSKKKLSDYVGYTVVTGYEETVLDDIDLQLIKIETGIGYGNTLDTGKPINFYTTLPIEGKTLLSNEFGVDINVKGYGISAQIGDEMSSSLNFPNWSIEKGEGYVKYGYIDDSGYYAYHKVSIDYYKTLAVVLCATSATLVATDVATVVGTIQTVIKSSMGQ